MGRKVPAGRGTSEIRGAPFTPPISMLGEFRVIRSSEKKYHLRGQLQGRTRSNIEIGECGIREEGRPTPRGGTFFRTQRKRLRKIRNQPANQPASEPANQRTNHLFTHSLTQSTNQYEFAISLNHQSRDDFNPPSSITATANFHVFLFLDPSQTDDLHV